MEALSRGGAKVLNRDAVAWARRVGVALYARSTFAPDTARGTQVRTNPPARPTPVVGVTGRTDWIRLEHISPDVLTGTLRDFPVVRQRQTGEGMTAWLVREDLPDADALIQRCLEAGISVEDGLGSVTVVGTGLGEDPETKRRLTSALSTWPNELSDASWTAWLPPEEVQATVRQLHDDLLPGV